MKKTILISALLVGVLMQPANGAIGNASENDHLLAAEQFLEEGKISPAISQLKSALRDDPNDVDARYLLGTVYLFISEGAAAEDELRAAYAAGMQTDDLRERLGEALLLQRKYQQLLDEILVDGLTSYQRAVVLSLRGRAWMGLQNYDEAQQAFIKAEQTSPELVAPKLGLVRLLVDAGNLAEAGQKVAEALAVDPVNRRSLLLQAELLRMSGKPLQAVDNFSQLLDRYPNFVEALLGRAASYLDSNKDGDAQTDLDRVFELNNRYPLAFQLAAMVLAKKQDYEAATSMLDRAGASLDSHPPAMFLRGLIAYSTNQPGQALYHLNRYVEAAPENANGRRLLGALLIRQSDYDKASQVLEPLLHDGQKHGRVFAMAASAQLGLQKFDRAVALFERAVALSPDMPIYRTQLALARLTAGQSETAVGELQAAVDASPEGTQASVVLARIHLANGEFDAVLAIALQLIDAAPDRPMGHNLQGAALLGLKDNEAATKAFKAALASDPTYFPAVQNLARMEIANGDIAAAKARFLDVLKNDESHEQAMIELSDIYLRGHDREAAREWLQKAMDINPASGLPALKLANMLIDDGNFEAAERAIQSLEVNLATEPRTIEMRARLHMLMGNPAAAAMGYARLVDALPTNASAWHALGKAQIDSGDIGSAQASFLRALELDPALSEAVLELINLEMDRDRFEEALEISTSLQASNPGDALGDILVGHVLARMGRQPEALAVLRSAEGKVRTAEMVLRLFNGYRQVPASVRAYGVVEGWLARHPDDTNTRRIIAVSYLQAAQYAEAARHYRLLQKADPQNPALLNNLAWLYQHLGDTRAVSVVSDAYRLQPGALAIMDTYGWVMVAQGDLQAGVDVLEQAWVRSPESRSVRYHLALGRTKQGRAGDACDLLANILAEREGFAERPAAQALYT
jgi:putative PEP-CTERM system TPR-repeat lipoprotein